MTVSVLLCVLIGFLIGVGGNSTWRRRSWRRRRPLEVRVKPRQERLARSSTAHTSFVQLASPGRRPITFTLLRVSPKVRSTKFECLALAQCSRGKRR